MRYTTAYDIGKRKRKQDDGVNEDSIGVTIIEDGHREGYEYSGPDEVLDNGQPDASDSQATEATTYGPGDSPPDVDSDATNETEVFASSEVTESTRAPDNREAGVFVLADGAGGEESGDIASYIASLKITQELSAFLHEALLARPEAFDLDFDTEGTPLSFDRPWSDETFQDAIESAIAVANEAIVSYANASDIGGTGSGRGLYTTVVAGIYVGNQLHYGWVGDSRIYVINESHEDISPLTKDHAKITRLADEGKVDDAEAHVHPDGNEIEQALGGRTGQAPEQTRERTHQMVDTNTVDLYSDDTVLFTSDGLIDAQTDAPELYRRYIGTGRDERVAEEIFEKVVTDDLIRDVTLEADSLQGAADEYIQISNEKGGKDNISVILLADDNLPDSPPAEESGLPERSIDPERDVEERQTIIRDSDAT